MKIVEIVNIKGTSDEVNNTGSDSYIKHWEEYKGHRPDHCSNLDCRNYDENIQGAHVMKAGADTTDEWYIVPLCHECNQNYKVMKVDEDMLVPLCVK